MVNHLGSQAKFGESDIVVEDLENYFNGHANLDVGWVWVGDDQIARHARAFFQLDDNWHIRGFVAEGRSGSAMDDRKGVDDALAAALDPVGVPGETLWADVSGIEIR